MYFPISSTVSIFILYFSKFEKVLNQDIVMNPVGINKASLIKQFGVSVIFRITKESVFVC